MGDWIVDGIARQMGCLIALAFGAGIVAGTIVYFFWGASQ